MAAIDDLNTKIQKLQSDVQHLIALHAAGATDAQVNAVSSTVDALDAQVQSALTSTQPPVQQPVTPTP